MKKIIVLLVSALFTGNILFAQAPGIFNYQGVARNSVGNVLQNKSIALRLSVHDVTATGTIVYSETRALVTNPYGLFNVQVGSAGATSVTGTIAGINWAVGNKYLQVEIDPEGGSAFINIGTAQLASVPYALNAGGAAPTGPAGGSLSGTYPNPVIANGAISQAMIAGGVTLPPSGAAAGDLSGTYPNPVVAGLRGRAVATTAPANGQALVWNGTTNTWEPGAGAASTLVLPFTANENNAAALFTINNAGDGTSILGTNATTTSSISAVRGEVTSSAPGGFSSAVRGINAGTGGLGIGVWGSQSGSGWGVYGVTPNGLGVYGNSSANGYGVYANSNSGTGLFATSNNGVAGAVAINNNANNNTVFSANTVGNGTVIDVSTTGSGVGVSSVTGDGFSVYGSTSSISSAGIVGENTAGGESVFGRNNSNIAAAVVGRNDGGGYGVRGFVSTNADGTAVGVLGQIGLNGSTGRGGRFENSNPSNIDASTLEVYTNTNGNIPDRTLGNAATFVVDNSNSVAAAVRGEVNTIFGNFGAAAVMGEAKGTGGFAGLFYQENTSGNGRALVALTDGNGDAVVANAGKDGDAIVGNVDGTGTAVYGWVPSFSNGRAGRFEIFNEDNDNEVINVKTVGNGTAGNFIVDNNQGTSAAVKGEVNSIFANFGTAAIYGVSSGTGGYAGLFHSTNPAGNTNTLIAINEGNGEAITANAGGNGNGVESTVDGNGVAMFGWVPNFSTGRAARFVNFNTSNTNAVLTVENRAAGDLAVFRSNTPAINVARIDATGRGFFNNGTQTGGADLAEAFDVKGAVHEYEAGDILVISTSKDRAVEKSAAPYSTLVAGVYATKPGVLLTEEHIDSELTDKVPMGVVGVIPTKVCLEGGVIRRGDMLVTSSIPGVAMKADPDKVKVGQVLGKALQDCTATGVTKINVLVNVK